MSSTSGVKRQGEPFFGATAASGIGGVADDRAAHHTGGGFRSLNPRWCQ
jgi:hypothetical protein